MPFGSAQRSGCCRLGLKDRALFEAYIASFPITWNLHFFLQSTICRDTTPSSFDFVGVMNATFKEQLDVLRRHPKAPPAFQDAVTVRFTFSCLGHPFPPFFWGSGWARHSEVRRGSRGCREDRWWAQSPAGRHLRASRITTIPGAVPCVVQHHHRLFTQSISQRRFGVALTWMRG